MIGVREAARELGLNPSTVSRYITQHPELNKATGGPPKVDLNELRDHRARTVNHAMSGNHAGLLQDEAEAADEASPKVEGGLLSARTRIADAQARRAELDLAERLGLVCDRSGVEAACLEAGRLFRNGLEARRRQMAEEFAGMDDPREIARRLDEEDGRLMLHFIDEMKRLLGDVAEGSVS